MIRPATILRLLLALMLGGCSAEPQVDIAQVERAMVEHRYFDAQRALLQLRETEGRSAQNAVMLAQVNIELGDGYTAERYLSEIRGAQEQAAQWTILSAQALILQGRPHKARELIEGAANTPLEDARLAWLLVWAAMEQEDLPGAETLLSQALAAHPQSADLHAKAARMALWQGDGNRADAHVEQTLTIDPRHYEALLLRGERRIAAGDLAGALAPYQDAARHFPDFAVARANVAGLLLDLGRLEEAEKALNEALQRHPDFALIRFNAARLQALKGRWKDARLMLQAIPSDWARGFPAAILLEGEIEAGLGNHANARTLFLSLADNPSFADRARELMAQLPPI
jgi:tetratricopeptide (TPR) repeat protein